ncbi:MAG: 3-deoxy-manno-octulosonate cytidylyltransferase [Sedimentisphaeraceae bacterium JB056]
MKNIVIIPARYDSTRFHGKVLAKETGKYLLQHTYEQVLKAQSVSDVYIATDSNKVFEACREFGGNCIMTSDQHKSGTDRIAEAAANIETDMIINVQADEPEISPDDIDMLAQTMEQNPEVPMGTLVTKISDPQWLDNTNVVKAILDTKGRAIYFSRAPIPHNRDKGCGSCELAYRHLGIYAYQKEFLLQITKMPQTPLEKCESLEQLRVIENGYPIITAKVDASPEGIDTQPQYEDFVERMKNK